MVLNSCATKSERKSIDTYQVMFFFIEECKISKNITQYVRKYHEKFSSEKFKFVAYFPATMTETIEGINAWKLKYEIPFEVFIDDMNVVTEKFQVKVAPSVVILDNNGSVIYSGRINNLYRDIGKKSAYVTVDDVEQVLSQLEANREITHNQYNEPVGCIITPYKR